MELEIVPYYDRPESLTVVPAGDGVGIIAPGHSMRLTMPVARSLAYRLLALAEYPDTPVGS